MTKQTNKKRMARLRVGHKPSNNLMRCKRYWATKTDTYTNIVQSIANFINGWKTFSAVRESREPSVFGRL